MAGFIDMIVEITAQGGLAMWRRNRRLRAIALQHNDPALEQRVQARAYQLWEAEGRPEGRAALHWCLALELEEAAIGRAADGGSLTNAIERLQFVSDLAEVQLLLDFISGQPDRAFSTHAPGAETGTPLPGNPRASLPETERVTAEDLQKIVNIRYPPTKSMEANAADAALLLQLRDKLNRFVYPASGLTVAFTLLTWVPIITFRRKFDQDWARWRLANQAYPRMGSSVQIFRYSAALLTVLAVFVTVLTVWASDAVSDGQANLARIRVLDQDEAAVDTLIDQFESVAPAPQTGLGTSGRLANAGPPQRFAVTARYCPHPETIVEVEITDRLSAAVVPSESAQHHEICDKREKLQLELADAVIEVQGWLAEWQNSLFSRCSCWMFRSLSADPAACRVSPASQTVAKIANGSVVAFPRAYGRAADTLSDLTGIWLPVAYGFIGSIVAALRSIYSKISTSTLAPWDTRLMWTRLMLGIIAGSCIGLFFTSTGVPVQGLTTVSTLSLSAVAFLAGYAVDGLFSMLDEIIKRLFRLESETARPTAPR